MSDDAALTRRLRRARRQPLFPPEAATVALGWDTAALQRLLPHRPPMLLIDAVTAWAPAAQGLLATRALRADDLGFAGHFPGDPIYPGALQVELMGQVGLLLPGCLAQTPAAEVPAAARPAPVRLIRILDAFFVQAARPGARLTVLAQVIDDDGGVLRALGQLCCGAQILSGCAFEALYAGVEAG